MCTDDLQVGSKGRYGSCLVEGITHFIPDCFRDMSAIKHYANLGIFYFTFLIHVIH